MKQKETLKIKIEDGFFKETSLEVDYFQKEFIIWKGWEIRIKPDGSFFAESIEKAWDGIYSIRYAISTLGYGVLTLKTPYDFKILHKGYVIPRGHIFTAGFVGLTSGIIRERYAYYRSEEFQGFLDRYQLTKVVDTNPNRMYAGIKDCMLSEEEDSVSSVAIYSDGITKNESTSSGDLVFIVNGASWAIVDRTLRFSEKSERCKILYTNVKELSAIEDSIAEKIKAPRDMSY